MTVGVVRVRYEQRHDVQRESRYEDRRPHGDQDDRQLRLLLLGGRLRASSRRRVEHRRFPLLELLLRALRLLCELGALLSSALCCLHRLHRLVHRVG